VAYHLTALGVRDVLLLEQGRLSSGTTWHAAGLVGQLRASESGTRLVQYSAALYQRLEAETGLGTGYKECGGVTVARTPERMVQLLRTAAAAEAYNLECEILTPAQAADRYPLLRTDDLQGAIWLPKDGTANPTDVTQSLAKGAKLRGARVVEKVRVTGLDIRDGLAAGVRTDQGDVECETLVLCAGQWTNALAATIGVTVPLHSAEHFYVVTEAIEGVHRMLATPTSRRRSGGSSSGASSRSPSRGSPRTRSPTPSSSSCSTRTGSTSRCSWSRPCTASRRWPPRG
jgi:4-methylaminobutanoate oxidase (formaldehyde-forming)